MHDHSALPGANWCRWCGNEFALNMACANKRCQWMETSTLLGLDGTAVTIHDSQGQIVWWSGGGDTYTLDSSDLQTSFTSTGFTIV